MQPQGTTRDGIILQGGRNPYVAVSLYITSLFEKLVGCRGTSTAWFVRQRLELAIINSVQKWREYLPGRLSFQTIDETSQISIPRYPQSLN